MKEIIESRSNGALGSLQIKLWILEPVEDLEGKEDPWDPWFDKAVGFIVRAATE